VRTGAIGIGVLIVAGLVLPAPDDPDAIGAPLGLAPE